MHMLAPGIFNTVPVHKLNVHLTSRSIPYIVSEIDPTAPQPQIYWNNTNIGPSQPVSSPTEWWRASIWWLMQYFAQVKNSAKALQHSLKENPCLIKFNDLFGILKALDSCSNYCWEEANAQLMWCLKSCSSSLWIKPSFYTPWMDCRQLVLRCPVLYYVGCKSPFGVTFLKYTSKTITMFKQHL